MVKGRVEGRLERRPDLDDEQLLDLVRARLVQGYDREALPHRIHLERGIDEAVVHRALATYDEERYVERAADRRSILTAGAGALAGGFVVGGVVALWGGLGAAIVSGAVAALAIGVIVLELRRRGRS